MIIDRYIFERFYSLMIDSNVSKTFTARYKQYLALKKHDDLTIDLNVNKVDVIHVQFDIESIWSIESLTLQISIELVKFHVIKTNNSFFLSLIDLNRLKAYFNNIINILNQNDQNRKFSIIRRFDHAFVV
jgi:hypothetical protein